MTATYSYRAGFRAAANDLEINPPDTPALAVEYWAGYRDAMEERELDRPRYEGSNDTHSDYMGPTS